MNELLLRNAIADKEFYTACANRELASGGWLSDWNMMFGEADKMVCELVTAIKSESKGGKV